MGSAPVKKQRYCEPVLCAWKYTSVLIEYLLTIIPDVPSQSNLLVSSFSRGEREDTFRLSFSAMSGVYII